jgi:hypothetical protein
LLAVAAWFTMLQTTSERVLEARGKTRCLAFGQIAKLLALPGLLVGGYALGGIIGMILGLALAEFGRYVIISWFVQREGLPVVLCDVRLTLLMLAVGGLAYFLDSTWGSHLPKWGRLAAEIVLLCGLWAALFAAWWSRGHANLRTLLRREAP